MAISDNHGRPLSRAAALPGWLAAAVALSGGVAAETWTCRHDGLVRHVVVFYPDAPATLPCEVFYSKPTENRVPRPLWSARNAEGYCTDKAAAFVERLRGWGWVCEEDAAP